MLTNYRPLQLRKLARKECDEQNQMRAGRWDGDHAAQAAKAGCIFTTFVDQLTIEKCPGPFPTFEMCN